MCEGTTGGFHGSPLGAIYTATSRGPVAASVPRGGRAYSSNAIAGARYFFAPFFLLAFFFAAFFGAGAASPACASASACAPPGRIARIFRACS